MHYHTHEDSSSLVGAVLATTLWSAVVGLPFYWLLTLSFGRAPAALALLISGGYLGLTLMGFIRFVRVLTDFRSNHPVGYAVSASLGVGGAVLVIVMLNLPLMQQVYPLSSTRSIVVYGLASLVSGLTTFVSVRVTPLGER